MQKKLCFKTPGCNRFSLKFGKIFLKPSSNGWSKLSEETVEQTIIFKTEVDHKRGHVL